MNNDTAYPPMPTGTAKDRMTDEEWKEALEKEENIHEHRC